jgi:hypothetical protein
MLRRQHHEGDAEDGVRARGEEFDLLAGMAGHRESELGSLRTADPVALHQLDALGPVDGVEVFDQAVGVRGNFEVPLLELLFGNRRVRVTPAASVDHLLVGENRQALFTPPLRADRAVGQAAIVQQQEKPLRPLVVLGRGRIDLARPVVSASGNLELTLEVGRIARNGFLGMEAFEQRVVFGRQSEGVPSHGMQHVVAGHAPEAPGDVARHVIVQVPDGQTLAGRIGKHFEQVKLRPAAVRRRQI